MALWKVGEDVCLLFRLSYGSIVRPFSPPLSRGGAWSFAPNFRPRGAQLGFPDRPPSARQLLLRGGGVGRRFSLRYNGISARKGGKRRENCCNRRSFCFAQTRKNGDAVSYLSLFCLSLHQTSKYLSFLPNQLLCVFFKYSLSRVCVYSPCSVL